MIIVPGSSDRPPNFMDRAEMEQTGSGSPPKDSITHLEQSNTVLWKDSGRGIDFPTAATTLMNVLNEKIITSSLREEDLRRMVADPTLQFDMDLFYRLVEETFKVNVYCVSMLKETMFEIPSHRYYHVRPSRSYRQCVVLYKTVSTSGVMQYNLVVSNSVISSEEDRRGLMSRSMSKRCHSLLVQSHGTTLVRNGSIYDVCMSNVDYLKLFTNNLRAVAVDGAGKSAFLVLGVSDANTGDVKGLCCVKCLQVQAPNVPQWIGDPLRISKSLAVRVFGQPKGIDYDGLVYDGFGVENGFVVFTKEGSQELTTLPDNSLIKNPYFEAIAHWTVVKKAYHLYSLGRGQCVCSWVDFEDRHVKVLSEHKAFPYDARNARESSSEMSQQREPSQMSGSSSRSSVRSPSSKRALTPERANRIIRCTESLPNYTTVRQYLRVVQYLAPEMMVEGRIALSLKEIKCMSKYVACKKEPLGMTYARQNRNKDDRVMAFASREAALNWCIQRDANEFSCCTMPLVDYVDGRNAKNFATYLYKEPVTKNVYMLCNASSVTFESFLLTCKLWKEKNVVCPPRISEILLSKADACGKEVQFTKRTIGLLHESILSTGMGCIEGHSSRGRGWGECEHLPASEALGGDGKIQIGPPTGSAAVRWFSNGELIPMAPSNLSKSIATLTLGDMRHENVDETLLMEDSDLYVVPTSAMLREMDHIVLVMTPAGRMEEASSHTSRLSGGSQGSDTSLMDADQSRVRYLKVLVYGTVSDYVFKNPTAMASLLDM